ncbi:polyA polymerase family protein [Histomonas meleagridis]|uniref:polyA polymerase family protein n=1 Tax=Histomonas meleagridis TaxID=135588 RepID=UPI003559674F|nr:polyA polymerase family protein [Histomonas meleagridis]KAH0804464.1 polyA polymerase family protein [Histomonas meleagridis]
MIDENIFKLESGESLTLFEKTLIGQIRQVCDSFPKPTIARIVGGWVRDKILGKENDDIDIAIEGCDCRAFTEKYNETFPITKIAIIEPNPGMSKHLTIARICINNEFWLDVCSLRPDDFTNPDSNSIGTPLSDARRRDFTINALFFNVNLCKVEDFVGGIDDLKNGIIRTPIDPNITLSDDPLRAIRSFRFAIKFSFKIDQSILDYIPSLKKAIAENVTKDRLSQELLKMMKGDNIIKALDLMIQTKVFSSVFSPPSSLDEITFLEQAKVAISRCNNTEFYFTLILALIYKDFYNANDVQDPDKPRKKISQIEVSITRNLKLSMNYTKDVTTLLKSAQIISKLPRPLTRLTVGKWVREIGDLWVYTGCLIFDEEDVKFYQEQVLPFVHKENLTEIIHMKPLLNGKQLADLHGLKKLGPQVADLLNQLVEWQIMNPNKKASDYIEFIKSSRK